jgi:hypothetical protein
LYNCPGGRSGIFVKKKNHIQVSLKNVLFWSRCKKKWSENTNNKTLCSKIYFQSSRNVSSARNCIRKEELYLRKIKIVDV